MNMESMRGGQGGVHMLLTAEQEAQQITYSARNMKLARLKQAKDEAEKEAVAYRTMLEEEYQKKISESSGSSDSNVKRLEEETEVRIKCLKDAFSSIRSEVVVMIMKHITTIKI